MNRLPGRKMTVGAVAALGSLLLGCEPDPDGAVGECPAVQAHAGNLIEVGGSPREVRLSRKLGDSATVRTLAWEGKTVVVLPPLFGEPSAPVVELREMTGELIRRVTPVAHAVPGAPGEASLRVLRTVQRYYEEQDTDRPLAGQEALHARARQAARASVRNLIALLEEAQRRPVLLGADPGAARVDRTTLDLLDRLAVSAQEPAVALDACAREATLKQELSKEGWKALGKAVAATVIVGIALAEAPLTAGASVHLAVMAYTAIWLPAAHNVLLDAATTEPAEHWNPVAAAQSWVADAASALMETLKKVGGALQGTPVGADAEAAEALSNEHFAPPGPGSGVGGGEGSEGGDGTESESGGTGAQDCIPPCEAGMHCVQGVCEELPAALSCQDRCCPGRDDSCQDPNAGCMCDEFCREVDDCCADIAAACGF